MTVEKSGHAGLWQGVVNLAEKLRDAVRREKSKGKGAVQAIAAVAYGGADKEAAR